MSLTGELRDPTSPVAHYLAGRFADLDPIIATWQRAVAEARTVLPCGRVDWALIGRAFGYQLGFAFCLDPPYAAILGACHYTATQQLVP